MWYMQQKLDVCEVMWELDKHKMDMAVSYKAYYISSGRALVFLSPRILQPR